MMLELKVDVLKDEFMLFGARDHSPKMKSITGYYWDFKNRCARYNADWDTYAEIQRNFFGMINEQPDLKQYLDSKQGLQQKMKTYQNLDAVAEQELIDLPSKTNPMKHQKVAQTLALDKAGFGLFMEPGCGKTKVAIDLIGHYYNKYGYRKILVVCPKSAIVNWDVEMSIHASFKYKTVVLGEGSSVANRELLASTKLSKYPVIVITNYETVRNLTEELTSVSFDIIVADEVHRIRNAERKTNKAMRIVSRLSKIRLGLTGTPIANSPADVFGIYLWLDSRVFGTQFFSFRNKFAKTKDKVIGMNTVRDPKTGKMVKKPKTVKDIIGWDEDKLSDKMYEIAYRVKKEDALDLPSENTISVPIALEPKARQLYRQLEEEQFFAVGAKDSVKADIVLTFMLRASQICGGFVKTVKGDIFNVSSAKMDRLEDLTLDLLEDKTRKIVIFARFRPELDAMQKMFEKRKIPTFRIDGSVSATERGKMIKEFQEGDKVPVFLLQTKAASESITLTRADTSIFYSLDFSPLDFEQAKSRIYRNGQTKKVTHYLFTATDTVDETIQEALKNKQNVADAVVDRFKRGRVV